MNEEMKTDTQPTPKYISVRATVVLTVLALAASILESLLRGSVFGVVFTVLCASLSSAAVIFSGKYYPLLIGIASYGVSFAITLDPLYSIASLEFVPVALVLAYSFKKKHTRISMICRVSAVLAVIEFLMLALTVYGIYGTLTADTVRTLFEGIHTSLADSVYDALGSVATESISLSYDMISSTIAYMLTLMPAIFITLYNIAAYLIQRTVIVIGRRVGAADMIYPESCIFKVSRAAAALYIASYLLTVFLVSDKVGIFGAVTENLIIILTPGLALLGVKDFIKRRKERISVFPLFPILGMAFLLFTVPVLFFGLAAFAGAWAAFRKH